MEVDGFFPETQLAKLVVRVEAHDPVSPDFALYFSPGVCDEFVFFAGSPLIRPQCKGCPSPRMDSRGCSLSIDVSVKHRKPNCVSMVAINRSLEHQVAGVNVQRWLLVPPENVRFWRTADYEWRVEWDEVGLKNYPDVWGEYQILRSRLFVKQIPSSCPSIARTTNFTTRAFCRAMTTYSLSESSTRTTTKATRRGFRTEIPLPVSGSESCARPTACISARCLVIS